MINVYLVPQDKVFAKDMSSLSSTPEVKNALGLTDHQTSIKGTNEFIESVLKQVKLGKQYSRVILNENEI